MATTDQRFDDELKRQQGRLDENHGAETRLYRDMLADSDAAYEALKTQARIDRALSELAGGPARSSATLKAREMSALRNELGDTERQRERFAGNVEHALAGLSRKKDADEVITENMDTARRNAMELNQHKFDAELNLQKQYHELDKENSVFNQMYKLYLKRLVDKDQFKAMTGIEVKAMPKPHKVVKAKPVAANAILYQVQSAVHKEKTSGQSYNGYGGMRNTASTPWSQYNGYGGMRRTGTQPSSDTSGGKKTGETVTYTDWKGMSNYVKAHENELTQQFGQTNVDMLTNYLNVNTANMLFEGKQLTPAVDGLNHIWSNADYYIGRMGADSFLELFNKSSLQAAEQIDGNIKMLNERGLQITVDFVNTYLPEVAGQYKYSKSEHDKLYEAFNLVPESFSMDDAVQHIKLPAWYKPPKEWMEDGLVELVNARADDAYWTSLLGEDYDTIWTDHQPTQEELKQAGLEYAKTLDENIDTSKIPDEYAINLGVYAINDKLIEKNETKQSKMADTNVDAERLSYSWNPKDGVTSVWGLNLEDLEWSPYGGAGDIQDKANGAISNILLKKFMPNAEVTEDDYAVLNDLGMTDIVDYLKNMETIQYSNLPGSAQEQLKKNAISTVKGIVEFQEKLEMAAPKEQEVRQNSDFEDVTADAPSVSTNWNPYFTPGADDMYGAIQTGYTLNQKQKDDAEAAVKQLDLKLARGEINQKEYDAAVAIYQANLDKAHDLAGEWVGYDFVTKDMYDTFTYLYVKAKETGDTSVLYDYFSIFKEDLTNAQWDVYYGRMKDLVNEPGPWGEIGAGVAALGGKLASGAAWLETGFDSITGQEVDTSSINQLLARSGYKFSELAASTTESKFGQWAIQSSIDLVAVAPAFFMTPVAGGIYIGLQTAGQDAAQQNEMGASAWESFVHSTVSGGISFLSTMAMLKGFGNIMAGTTKLLPVTFGQKLMAYGMNTLEAFGLGSTTTAVSTLFMNVADMLIAGERSQYAQFVKDYMDNGMTKEQAMSAAGFDVFAKQPILEGAKGGAMAAVMSLPGTAGSIRSGETLGGRAAVADEQGAFRTLRAMEAGPAAQAQAVKTNIANGLAMLEQANARLSKQGGNTNKTAFKTDMANNALMDYLTGKGNAQSAADAFRKIANEAIASGKLTAQEAATLKGAMGQTKAYVDAMAFLGDNGIGKQINSGTLNNVEARKWYLENEARIPEFIDRSLLLEQQAKQAFNLRNQFRRQARELMADRELAESLNKSDPNLSWEQIVQKQIDKGYKGDDIFRAIIESSQRSRKSVNMQLGLE